jgi:Fur family ferric uptake transcriptional regulator
MTAGQKEDHAEIRGQIMAYMEANGLRMTNQRRAIIEAAFTTTEHYTAEDLLSRAKAIDPSVSRATVYRTLSFLVKTSLLRELDLGKGYAFYDPNYAKHPNHNHLICRDCERIVEFEDYCLDVRENVIAKELGYRPETVRLRIEARCETLAKTGTCAHRTKTAP